MRLAAGRALAVFALLTLARQNLPAGSTEPVKNRPPLAPDHFNLLPRITAFPLLER